MPETLVCPNSTRSPKPSRPGIRASLRSALLLFLGIATPSLTLTARAEVIIPGIQAARLQGVEAGIVLIQELNCFGCHSPGTGEGFKSKPRLGPDLADAGSRLELQWIRAFLEQPHQLKPGTPMPNMLQAFPVQERPKMIDRLVHFLADQSGHQPDEPVAASDAIIEQGRQLYHRVGCVACHAPFDTPTGLATPLKQGVNPEPSLPTLAASIPLGDLATKTTVRSLARFLMDPLKTRSTGRMPSLGLSDPEASAIAMYLVRAQAVSGSEAPARQLSGVAYQYFEGDFREHPPDFAKLVPVATGTSTNFSLEMRQRDAHFALRFSGTITITNAGTYTFFTDSDDGSLLNIGKTTVVTNDGFHAATERWGSIHLDQGEHPIEVLYFNGGGESLLRVLYQGPRLPKRPIPATALSHLAVPMTPAGRVPFTLDMTKVMEGREVFSTIGCAQCHSVPGGQARTQFAPSFRSLADSKAGCLSAAPPVKAPRYNLSESQRIAIAAALRNPSWLDRNMPPSTSASLTMASLHCYACHSRDGLGGPDGDRLEYFLTEGQLDLGDEGRIPPHLTGVGSKLREEALRNALNEGFRTRPYMQTRMPLFGDHQVSGFLAWFSLADAFVGAQQPPPFSAAYAKHGRTLVGTDGLSCISCHNMDGKRSLGIPAMDLAHVGPRLRYDWFRRYLLDPASLRPGTRMPAFWTEGKSSKPGILGGDPEKQIQALWTYLQSPKLTGLPEGLIQPKQELIPSQEPILYRNFITGAGPRAIEVGYPEKVNLAFDAENVRLALVWQGGFMDASRHWTGRGEGSEPPLGHSVIPMPSAPAFAVLPSPDAPWPAVPGRNNDFKMMGYQLNAKRRPKFLYRFGTLQIEESFEPIPSDLDHGLRRSFILRGLTSDRSVWMRALEGRTIVTHEGPTWLADGRVRLQLLQPPTHNAVVRKLPGDRRELIVPIPKDAATTTLTMEIQW